MMGEKDPAAAAAQKYKPIQSAVPGTTLGPIQIDAFFGGGVWDSRYLFLCYAIAMHPKIIFLQSHFLTFLFAPLLKFDMMQKLFDTPGVHLHHRQAAVIHSDDLPVLAPRSRLKGLSLPVSCF